MQRNWQDRVHKMTTSKANKRYSIPENQLEIDNPEKLARSGTQDDDKQNK